eukprot:scaffold23809_cov62-Cyclotella_meneghiniana.AAC.9
MEEDTNNPSLSSHNWDNNDAPLYPYCNAPITSIEGYNNYNHSLSAFSYMLSKGQAMMTSSRIVPYSTNDIHHATSNNDNVPTSNASIMHSYIGMIN